MKQVQTEKVHKSRIKNLEYLKARIRQAVNEHPYFGYRRIHALLKYRYHLPTRRNTVYQVMQEMKLVLPPTAKKKQLFKGVPVRVNTQAKSSNTLWGIDLTYIWCGQDCWAYLHAVVDHFDKVILGYNFSRSCGALGGVLALAEAASRRPVDQLELRSDNGCHYGSKLFREEITRLGIEHTRTLINTPEGNAVIERFFRSLKQECVWQYQFKNFEEAKKAIDRWIEFYNNRRPHQALNYATPATFYEAQTIRIEAENEC